MGEIASRAGYSPARWPRGLPATKAPHTMGPRVVACAPLRRERPTSVGSASTTRTTSSSRPSSGSSSSPTAWAATTPATSRASSPPRRSSNFFEATCADADPAPSSPEDEARRPRSGAAASPRACARRTATSSPSRTRTSSTTGWARPCVAIHLADGTVHVAHVGDSRCYRIRDGKIEQMTRDHSLVNDALDMKPDLTEEELAPAAEEHHHPRPRDEGRRQGRRPPEPVAAGRRLPALLGRPQRHDSGRADPRGRRRSPTSRRRRASCSIAEANDAGGTDNISAVLVRIEEAPAEEPKKSTPPAARPASSPPAAPPRPASKPPAAPAPSPKAKAISDAPPELVTTLDRGLDSVLTPSVRMHLENGGEFDLELAGPWAEGGEPSGERCPKCDHALYSGNAFCVECGTRVEAR